MSELLGKVAIVTGAGGKRGIGRAIAKRLAVGGADIVVSDKYNIPPRGEDLTEDWKGLESVAEEIEALGRQCLPLTCDISDSKDVDRMVAETMSRFSRIDILVNNAGVDIYGGFLDFSDELWNLHLAVNLTGTFYCSRAVARELVKMGEGGRIINIASMLGKVGMGNGQTAYCSSKFGVIGFTQSLALELAPYKILVNAVCPALMPTDIHSEDFKKEAERDGTNIQEVAARTHERIKAQVPLGRLGTPEDTANMVAFLTSKEADYITGQSINVNGGLFTAH